MKHFDQLLKVRLKRGNFFSLNSKLPVVHCQLSTLIVALLLLLLPAARMHAQENGTESHPFLIENPEELKAFRNGVNKTTANSDNVSFYFHNGTYILDTVGTGITDAVGIQSGGAGTYFKLTADIVINAGNVGLCNGVKEASWEEWVPIGWSTDAAQSFYGHFDGDFHTISGIYINGSTQLGLFGSISDAEVKNLAVSNSYIKGERIVGGICGWNTASTISHCWSAATVVATKGNAGGIAGNNTSSASTVATIEYCYNAGLVRAQSLYAGGITAYNIGGMVDHCYNSNSVLGEEDYIGAITGLTESGGMVSNCYYDNLFAFVARDGATAYPTNAMTTNTVAAGLGGEYTYVNGYYPQLTGFTASAATSFTKTASTFSAVPVILPTSSDANGINGDFALGGTSMGIIWNVSNARAHLDGNTVVLDAKGDFYFTAFLSNNYTKIWYLNSRVGLPQGTEDNPFSVESADALINLVNGINSGNEFWFNGDPVNPHGKDMFFALTNDIDMNPEYSNDYIKWTEDSVPAELYHWTSMGTPENPFMGHFRGNGYTLAGIYGEPFIGVMDSGSVKSLGLVRGYVNSGKHFGYVSDGLVMHYDGIQNTRDGHDANAKKWEDLAGTYDLTPYAYQSLEWADDHILMKGDSAFLLSGINNYFLWNHCGKKMTLEFVAYVDCDNVTPTTRGLMGGYYDNANNFRIQTTSSGGKVLQIGGLDVTGVDDQVVTLAYTSGVTASYLNGEYKTASFPVAGDREDAIITFGNSLVNAWGSRGFNDSIYAIRIYNRTLTTAEIAQNAEVDRLRFVTKQGGGYTGTVVSVNRDGVVSDCFSALEMHDGAGLVGFNSGTVSNSVYAGNAIGKFTNGLVGHNVEGATVSNCYMYGTQKGTKVVAGDETHVTDNVYDKQLSPQVTSSTHMTGSNTADMLTSGKYPMPSAFNSSVIAQAVAQPVLLNDDIRAVSADFTLGGCADNFTWDASMGINVSGCNASKVNVGDQYVNVAYNGMRYKTLRMHLGNVDENTFYIGDVTEFNNFRTYFNTGKEFYYSPTDHAFSNVKSAQYNMVVKPCGEGQRFALTADIDLGGGRYTAIGNFTDLPFKGTFDGQGHTISNYKMTNTYGYALFRRSEGIIENLGVENVILTEYNAHCVAPLCAVNNGIIRNCHSSNLTQFRTSDNEQFWSALVSMNLGGTIENCYVENDTMRKTVAGRAFYLSGMLCGGSYNGIIRNCRVENCYAYNIGHGNDYAAYGMMGAIMRFTEVTGCVVRNSTIVRERNGSGNNNYGQLGMIAGNMWYGKIDSCFVYNCVVNAEQSRYVGGLLGSISYGKVTNCHTIGGTVIGGPSNTGGLCGSAGATDLTYCHNSASVTDWGASVGGLIGYFSPHYYRGNFGGSTIDLCWNEGDVTAHLPEWVTENLSDNTNSVGNATQFGNVTLGGLIGQVYGVNSEAGKRYMAHINRSFNMGKVTSKRVTYSGSRICVGGLVGYTDNNQYWEMKNCFNAGSVQGGNDDAAGIAPYFRNNTPQCASENIYNIGRVTAARRAYPITANNNRLNATTYFYYDEQMCPDVYIYSGNTKDISMTTRAMLGNGMRDLLGTDNWVYTSGMYPRIKGLENEAASIAAATPVYLYEAAGDTENVAAVNHNFTTGSGMHKTKWKVIEGDGIIESIANDTVYTLASDARGVIELYARVPNTLHKDTACKKVELFVGLEKPFLVINEKELRKFRDGINSRDYFYYDKIKDTFSLEKKSGLLTVPKEGELATFKLTANLDLDSIPWEPIAMDSVIFKGNFDGGNHTISKLFIENTTTKRYYAGLFAQTGDGYIKNLGLINPSVTATAVENYAAGIVVNSYGRIDSCYVEGGFIHGRQFAGSICARHYSLASTTDSSYQILRCWNSAEVVGSIRVGGIVGQDVSCTKWCYNMGEVRTPNENDYTCRVGGIAGITSTPLHQCFNMGVVRGSKMVVGYTGGLVGEGYAVSSYNVGEVIGNKSTGTGGITGTYGANDYNLRTYNAARVTGTGNTSPINGSGYREQYSYFDSQLCPSTRKINGTAMTTRQMLDSGLYEKSVELYPAANKRSYWFSSENGWTLVDTLYPQITYFAGTPASIASVTPVKLVEGENVLSVATDFLADTNRNVRWQLVAGGGLVVDDDSIHVKKEVIGIATLQDFINGVAYKKVRFILMSPDNPLIIRNMTELKHFRDYINSGEVFYYRIDSTFHKTNLGMEDELVEIPVGGEEVYFKLADTIFNFIDIPNWEPIGNFDNHFSGYFNGNSKHVLLENMRIDSVGSYLGLFGYSDGTIDSVRMDSVVITDKAEQYVGAVCGYSMGSVSACTSSYGNVSSSGNWLGGLIGFCDGGNLTGLVHYKGVVKREEGVNAANTGGVVGYIRMGKVSYCHNDSSMVVGRNNVGGVIGYHYGTDSVKCCYTIGGSVLDNLTSNSSANNYIGGVIGQKGAQSNSGRIVNCYNEGTVVNAHTNYVAGVVGYNTNASLQRCYNTADVTGREAVYGIVGYSGGVTFAFNKGNITATGGTAVGISANISSYCLNIGNVTGSGSAYGMYNGNSSATLCLNAGRVVAKNGSASGICNEPHGTTVQTIKKCVNVGEVISYTGAASAFLNGNGALVGNYNAGRVNGVTKTGAISCLKPATDSYYDRQMMPNPTFQDYSNALPTAEMIGDAGINAGFRASLGEDDWIYQEGMYPRPLWTDTVSMPYVREAAIVACTPVFFSTTPEEQHVNMATDTVTFGSGKYSDGSNANVQWSVESGTGLTINGYTGVAKPVGISYIHAALPTATNPDDSVYKRMRVVITSDMDAIPIKNLAQLKRFRDCINNLQVDGQGQSTGLQQPFYYNKADSTFTVVRPVDLEADTNYFEIPAGGEGVHFKLITDIVSDVGKWEPIGDAASNANQKQFRGYFNGDNHTVGNIVMDNNQNYKGLFGKASGAEIKNLHVQVSMKTTSPNTNINQYAGGVVAYAQGCNISCCRVDGVIQGYDIGGIVGYSTNNIVRSCYNAATVEYNPRLSGQMTTVGGIAGYSDNILEDCYNVGEIIGNNSSFVGGLVGNGKAERCYNLGHVTGNISFYSISGTNFYTDCFNDVQLVPDLPGATNKLTVNMTGDALKSVLGDDGTWTYADNMYPRLSCLDTCRQAIVYASPVYLYGTQNVNTVRTHFDVGHEEGVVWSKYGTGAALDVTYINDPSAEHNVLVVDCGEDTLQVTKDGVSRIIPISIYVDRLEVTQFEAYTCGDPFFWDVSNKYYTRTGTYTETFATKSGCDSVVSLKLTVPAKLSGSISPIQISCFGENDARLTASISGGFGHGYLYKWINDSDDTLNIEPTMSPADLELNPLVTGPGIFKVLVMDSLHNECQYMTDPVTIVEPAKLETQLVEYGTICKGAGNAVADRYIKLRMQGGRAPYTISYSLNGGSASTRLVSATEAADVITIENLGVGTYTVSIHDQATTGQSACDTVFDPVVFDGDPNVYTVTAASYNGKYDGNYHDARNYAVASNGTVIPGADAVASTEGYVLNRTAEYKDSLIVTILNDGVYEMDAGHYDNSITSCSVLRVYADGTTPNEEVRCRYNIGLVNGTVDIAKREITLTSASAVEVYTGSGTLSAESVTPTGDAWVSGEEPSYTGYAVLDHIGSIPNTFTINYVTGVNYTDNYTIHVVNGTLTYLGSDQDVVFTAPTLQKTYDGKEWTTDTVAAHTTTNLDLATYRYELTVNSASHIKDVDTVESIIDAVRIYNRSTDEEVTNTTFAVHVVIVNGTLAVTPVSITLSSSSASEVYSGDTLTRPVVNMTGSFVTGDVSDDPKAIGKIVDYGTETNVIDYHPTSSFNPVNYNLVVNEGTLKITKREITITGESLTIDYTGDTIRLTTVNTVNLVSGHTLSGLDYLAKGKDVGDYPGTFTGLTDYEIHDADGRNVKGNYNVTSVTAGLLKITSNDKNLEIASKSGSTIYMGSNFKKEEYTVTYDGQVMPFVSPTQFILSTGDTLTVVPTATAVKHVDDNTPNNNTFNYILSGSGNYTGTITTVYGTLEIEPRPLNLKSDDGTKRYDGTALTVDVIVEQASSYGFVPGEGFDYTNFPAPVKVGTYENNFDYAPMSGTDTRLSDYTVGIAYGTLTITKAECTLTPDDVTRQYGEDNPTTWEYSLTDLAATDSEADMKDTLTSKGQPVISTTATTYSVPGTYPITADPNQIDLWNYDVTPQPGTLTIEPLALVLKAQGDTVYYDGAAHAVSGYTMEYNGTTYTSTGGTLTFTVADTSYSITATTSDPDSKVDVGVYANSFSGTPTVTRTDDPTADRTGWFAFTTVDSALVILPDTTKIYITSYDKEWTYDGVAHSYTKYTVKRGTQTYEINDGETAEVTLATGDKLTISNPKSVTNVSDNAANNNTYTVTFENSGNYESDVIVKTMGTLTITPMEVTITANDSTKVYDGEAMTQPKFTVSALASTDAHTFTVVMTSGSTITDVGTETNEIATVDGQPVITGTAKVIGNYKVTTATGTLEVTPREVTITANDSTKVYDGEAMAQPKFTVTGMASGDTHVFTVVMTSGSTITDVGTKDNEIATVDGQPVITGTAKVIGNYKVTTATGTLEVTPREVTITANDSTKVYDGEAMAQPKFTVTGMASGDIHVFTIVMTSGSTITDVGTKDNEIATVDGQPVITGTAKVIGNYKVTTATGTLEVTPREVTITANDSTKVYDGEAMAQPKFTVTGMASGDTHVFTVVMTSGSTITDVGTKDNEIATVDGQPVITGTAKVIGNYKVTTATGTLEVTPREVTITANDSTKVYDSEAIAQPKFTVTGMSSGDTHVFAVVMTSGSTITNKGTKDNEISTVDGQPVITGIAKVIGNYKVTTAKGQLEVTSREVTVSVADSTTDYNGLLQYGHDEYVFTNVAAGQTATITYTPASGTLVGTYTNGTYGTDFKVMDGSNDVTSNYTLGSQTAGKLTIKYGTPIALTLTARDTTWEYDQTDHTFHSYILKSASGIDTIVRVSAGGDYTFPNGDLLHVEFRGFSHIADVSTAGVVNRIASYTITHDGTDVLAAYTVNPLVDGLLQISPRPVTITSADSAFAYDGSVKTQPRYTVDGLLGTDALTAVVNGSIQFPSQSPQANTISTHAFTSGNAANYSVNYAPGTLTMTYGTLVNLTITADSATWTYDGSEHSKDSYKIKYTYNGVDYNVNIGADGIHELPNGDKITVNVEGRITDYGTRNNVATVQSILHGTVDVSGAYNVPTPTNGLLTVNQRPLTIKANSDEKVYDGSALTNSGYSIVNGTSLAVGDNLESVTLTGSQTYEGSSDNVASNAVIKRGSEEVTGNYDISYQNGTLTVTANTGAIVITSGNYEDKYDGNSHTNHSYTVTFNGLTCTEVPSSVGLQFFIPVSSAKNDTLTMAPTSTASVKDVDDGTVNNSFTYTLTNSSSYQYTPSTTFGTLKVNPRQITMTSETASKLYDGTPLTRPTVTVTGDGIINGEIYNIVATGTVTDISEGVVPNTITFDTTTAYLRHNYNIIKNEGTLQITGTNKAIVITSATHTWPYDGLQHSDDTYEVTFGGTAVAPAAGSNGLKFELLSGDTLRITPNASRFITYVGSTVNAFDYTIDNPGVYVGTKTKNEGTLTITPNTTLVTVTVTGHNHTDTYDGTEHTVTGFDLASSNTLYPLSSVTFSGSVADSTASRTVKGTTNMGLATTMFGNADTNMTNVTFNIVDGYQKIEPNSTPVTVTVTGHNHTDTYDGTEHTVTGFDMVSDNTLYPLSSVTYSGGAADSTASRTVKGTTNMGLSTLIFHNVDTNMTNVTFNIVDGYQKIEPNSTPVTVTVTGHKGSSVYDSNPHTTTGYDISIDNPLFPLSSVVYHGTAADSTATRIVVDTTFMTLNTGLFQSVDTNMTNVTFVLASKGYQAITPVTSEVVVTLKEHGGVTTYDGYEQRVSGYDEVSISNTLYTTADYKYNGPESDTIAKGRYVGIYPMNMAGTQFVNLNNNFTNVTFTVQNDSLVINPNSTPIVITAASAEKPYDGTPLVDSTYSYAAGVLANGDTLVATVVGTITNYGDSLNRVTEYKVYRDETKNTGMIRMGLRMAPPTGYTKDVTDCYTFSTPVAGHLRITPNGNVVVTITGHTGEYNYDGTVHHVGNYDISIVDTLGIYTQADFHFTGDSTIDESTVGTYNMNLAVSQFVNDNANYNPVTFNITDGWMIIYDTLTVAVNSVDSVTCKDNNDGKATLTVAGGKRVTSPYYSYDVTGVNTSDNYTGTTDGTFNLTGLEPDTYNVTITDALSYTATTTFLVEEPAALTANVTGPTDLCPNQASYAVEMTTTGGNGGNHFSWYNTISDGATVADADALNTVVNKIAGNDCGHTYKVAVKVTDRKGCEARDTVNFTVVDTEDPTFVRPDDITICRNAAGEIDASTSLTGEPDMSSFSDNCTAPSQLVVSFRDADTTSTDNDSRVIHRVWSVTDLCGNHSEQTQNITVRPAINAPGNLEFNCPANIDTVIKHGGCNLLLVNIGTPTVVNHTTLDETKFEITNNAPSDNIYEVGETTVTWTITDSCGFSLTCDQIIKVSFQPCPVAIDNEQNRYPSVRLGRGCKCWTTEDLKSTQYSDGRPIDNVMSYYSREYPNVQENVSIFGHLYDWYAAADTGRYGSVDSVARAYNMGHRIQGICPAGWYLPSDEEFEELNMYPTTDLRSTSYWIDGAENTNATGFNSLPGGKYSCTTGRYEDMMGNAYYWTCHPVYDIATGAMIDFVCEKIRFFTHTDCDGHSVRCIWDEH